jgi:pimeloyl-ACP methyl ester carboxylesterase
MVTSDKTLRQICLEAGADEVGFVEIDRPGLAQERHGILQVYPATRSIIALVRVDEPGKSAKSSAFILQQKLPDARLMLFPDSGHGSHFQFPEEFAEAAAHFLAAD